MTGVRVLRICIMQYLLMKNKSCVNMVHILTYFMKQTTAMPLMINTVVEVSVTKNFILCMIVVIL